MLSLVQLYCWRFISYPCLPDDFDETQEAGWVKVPNTLWDHRRHCAGQFKEMEEKMQLELAK